jgi:hypothetical protein
LEGLDLVYRFFEKYRPTVVWTSFSSVIVELIEDVDIRTLPGVLGGWVAFYTIGGAKLDDIQSAIVDFLLEDKRKSISSFTKSQSRPCQNDHIHIKVILSKRN